MDGDPSHAGKAQIAGVSFSWLAALASILAVAMAFAGAMMLDESRESRYREAGQERAAGLLSSRMARATAIDDPVVRVQSWAYVNRLQECVSGRTGVFMTSAVSRSMVHLANDRPLSGLDQEGVIHAVKEVEKRCNGALITEIAITDPAGALALAAELKEQGLYLPQEVLAEATKNRAALTELRPLALSQR